MVEPAFARCQARLIIWAYIVVPKWSTRLHRAVAAGDIAEQEMCLQWFADNGVDSTESY